MNNYLKNLLIILILLTGLVYLNASDSQWGQLFIQTSAPSNNITGSLWVDTTQGTTKKYDGSNWVAQDGLLAVKKSLNLNQTNTDNSVTVNATKYLIRKVTITNASINLGANLATVGIFSGTSAGGSTIVAAALIQALTASTKYVDSTVALNADTLTSSTLYIRNVVTAGTAATVDVYIFGDVLP